MDLINKKFVKFVAVPCTTQSLTIDEDTDDADEDDVVDIATNNGEQQYSYIISRVRATEINMDPVQSYIYNWIFEDVHSEDEQVNLQRRLKEISMSSDIDIHIKELDEISTSELEKLGANKKSVPISIRIADIVILILSIIMAVAHIAINGLNVQMYSYTIIIAMFVLIGVFVIIPLIAVGTHLIMFLMAYIRRLINIENEKGTGQKVKATSISIFIMVIIIAIGLALTSHSFILVIDEIMIGIAILLVRTDNLMLKNDNKILDDYYNLKRLKEKIEDYSLLNEKNAEFIKLWQNYISYSVAFGNSKKISSMIKKVYAQDIDIEYLKKWEGVYYICKSYFEIFWGFKFKPIEKVNNILETDSEEQDKK